VKIDLFTPRISKHYLLLVAALVWTFAGGMLLFRGYLMLLQNPEYLLVKLLGCLFGGLVFFRLVFHKISAKHISRMKNLSGERSCMFAFFNFRSYFMMAAMITTGIILRKTGIISSEYLSLVYLTMGIPLLTSSFRFYYAFFK